MTIIARGMHSLGVSFDAIFTSPYRRAQQTAHLVAKVFHAATLTESKYLLPGGDPLWLLRDVRRNRDTAGGVLLVGHEPGLSRFIADLVTKDTNLNMVLKKGGLCKLTIDSKDSPRSACLQWLLTPAQLVGFAQLWRPVRSPRRSL